MTDTRANLVKGGGLRWRTPSDIRSAKREFQIKFDRAIVQYAEKPLDELKALLEAGISLPALTKMAIKTLVKAAETGQTRYMELVLYSSIRKVHKRSGTPSKKSAETPQPPDLPSPGDL